MRTASRTAAQLLAILVLAALSIRTAHAEDFAQRYQRDYNIYSPVNRYLPSNPLNGVNRYDPNVPFGPLDH